MIETGQGVEMDLSLKTDQLRISEAVDKFFRKWRGDMNLSAVRVTVYEDGSSVVDYYTGGGPDD